MVGSKYIQTAVVFDVYGSTKIIESISVNEPFDANQFIHPQEKTQKTYSCISIYLILNPNNDMCVKFLWYLVLPIRMSTPLCTMYKINICNIKF